MELAGKVLVVTGGGSGIGREVVLELLARGAGVAAVSRSRERLAETSVLAVAAGRTPLLPTHSVDVAHPAEQDSRTPPLSTHSVDVTNRAAVAGLPQAVLDVHGRVDGVVNVAGIVQPFRRVAELDHSAMETVMAVNFWGVVHMARAFLPLLLQRPEASLVTVVSMGALAPVPGQVVYGASKAAATLLMEGMRGELRGSPVAVTVVVPGGIRTDICDNSGVVVPPGVARHAERIPLTSPRTAARRIVRGVEHGSPRVVIGADARLLDLLSRLSRRRTGDLLAARSAHFVGD
jgi:NAD(P)-dependent dehydrogenase (short-subunit alcohol dehydrogenase family)